MGARLKAHMAAATTADRDMMLKQIESLKNARQEAEHLRHECHRLQNELTSQVHTPATHIFAHYYNLQCAHPTLPSSRHLRLCMNAANAVMSTTWFQCINCHAHTYL